LKFSLTNLKAPKKIQALQLCRALDDAHPSIIIKSMEEQLSLSLSKSSSLSYIMHHPFTKISDAKLLLVLQYYLCRLGLSKKISRFKK
jgi:hypothetical protein